MRALGCLLLPGVPAPGVMSATAHAAKNVCVSIQILDFSEGHDRH